jgi:hypothetical protein
MTDPKEKQKPVITKREPKKVKSSGLFDNLRPLPHPIEEIMGLNVPLSPSGGQSPSDPQTTPPVSSPVSSVAPERDFNRRANSLERDALPSGLFPGSSKKLYDALYLRTRGAIKPCRTIRATKKDLADWSGIRNRKTIDSHLRYLTACGLLERKWELGNVEGYLFEVRLPEETSLVDRGGQRGDSPPDHSDQKSDRGTDQKRDTGGQSQVASESMVSGAPKTFIKTDEEIDDEPFGKFAFALQKATEELTGKRLTKNDREKLAELADLLVTELKIAAGRTTVSSVPAFLTEHLRRRLWKKDKQQLREEGKAEARAAAFSPEDIRSCPDCGGTGFYYPNGYDGGVSRCQHRQIAKETSTEK